MRQSTLFGRTLREAPADAQTPGHQLMLRAAIARPRAGLLRVREFVMKDAYSFDADQAGLEKSYKAQHGAYERIFKRMGLDAISVESDTGAMGGDVAHEFQVLTEAGDDRIVICSRGDYKANMEKATRTLPT